MPIRPPSAVWTVAALVGAVTSMLEYDFASCIVEGEISGWSKAGSGHCYFTLKDAGGQATLRCALFRRAALTLGFAAADGQAVQIRGRLSVYEPRGELQFVVEAMQRSGEGALYERFVRLRARLEAEGLFAAEQKRALPAFPAAIGVVTSLAGAALHDVVTTLARRSPHLAVVVYPSAVQGNDAPAALCMAIAAAGARNEVDVLIVCRGGGSLEDLWAFNDERVVRAMRAAPMPVVSGVGHETDVTLADLAADVRAATPTAAAELVAPETSAQLLALRSAQAALSRRVAALVDTKAQCVDRLAVRLARPGDGVRRRALHLDVLARRLAAATTKQGDEQRGRVERVCRHLRQAADRARGSAAARIDRAALQLTALDPERVLARGYAILTNREGRAVTSIGALRVGARVQARLVDGQALLEVAATAPRPRD